MAHTLTPPNLATLAAAITEEDRRHRRIRLSLRPREHEQLQELAEAAGVPVAGLARRLLLTGLQRLGEDAREAA